MAFLLFEPVVKPMVLLKTKAEAWRKGTRFMDVELKIHTSEGLTMADLVQKVGWKAHHFDNFIVNPQSDEMPFIRVIVFQQEGEGRVLAEQRAKTFVGSKDNNIDTVFNFSGPISSFGSEVKVKIVLPIGCNGARQAHAILDLDDLAVEAGEHEINDLQKISVEVPNPITKKLFKVGKINIEVRIKFASAAPSWKESALVGAKHMVDQGWYMLSKTKEMYEENVKALSEVDYTIVIDRAEGLPAADRNGMSDPYLTLTHANQFFFTTVWPKTVNPAWDERFRFVGKMG